MSVLTFEQANSPNIAELRPLSQKQRRTALANAAVRVKKALRSSTGIKDPELRRLLHDYEAAKVALQQASVECAERRDELIAYYEAHTRNAPPALRSTPARAPAAVSHNLQGAGDSDRGGASAPTSPPALTGIVRRYGSGAFDNVPFSAQTLFSAGLRARGEGKRTAIRLRGFRACIARAPTSVRSTAVSLVQRRFRAGLGCHNGSPPMSEDPALSRAADTVGPHASLRAGMSCGSGPRCPHAVGAHVTARVGAHVAARDL
jgi:hypothetical protein